MATKKLMLLGIAAGLLVCGLARPLCVWGADPAPSALPEETKAQRDQRMA